MKFRMPSIVCSLFLWPGQTSFQMLDVLALQPSQTPLLGRLRGRYRRPCRRPSQLPRSFRVFQASSGVQQVPRRCDLDVDLQQFGFFGSQGLLAKLFHLSIDEKVGNISFSTFVSTESQILLAGKVSY